MSGQPLKLFVNYRRADDPDFVQHMRTWFMIRYGRENVFMDFDTIPEFARFEDFIREKVRESDAIVAVIGHNWLKLLREKEHSERPDYVRIELEEALKHNKVIAPICIKGASVPPTEEVPSSLRPIFRRNVATLRDGRDILEDMQRILDSLETQLTNQGTSSIMPDAKPEVILPQRHATFDIWSAADRLSEAYEVGDWPTALGWITRLRESGAVVPDFFKLPEIEADILETLRAEEEIRRRREMAEYEYSFVRYMVRLRRPAEDIYAALESVWRIETGYDPDKLADKFAVPKPPPKPRRKFSDEVRSILGEPFEWVEVPEGSVVLEDATHYGGTTGGKYNVGRFAIARYPITNAQYQLFMEAHDGYGNPQWWEYSRYAIDWYQRKQSPEETAFPGDDLPRTNVSWYSAMAFCNWLSYKTDQNILLPAEHQWQRAAQGDYGLKYPWGDEFDGGRCNFMSSNPTSVTQFPDGASPYGVMDMCGNIWQWCLNEWGTDGLDITSNRPRAMRGGTWWVSNEEALRCTYRFGIFPNLRLDGGGFRIVLDF
ncbi:MAG: SUMF1/EgtB/PvdO family nonheme iron enzyme [Chloroflexi bacterium]|nr:SUMF1/EgtB/PvdO family nonheme iron enzyme [Chloroflexota bacterium]